MKNCILAAALWASAFGALASEVSDFACRGLRCPGASLHISAPTNKPAVNYLLVSNFTTNGSNGQEIPFNYNLIEHRDNGFSPSSATLISRYPDLCSDHPSEWPVSVFILTGTNSYSSGFTVNQTNTLPAGKCAAIWSAYPQVPTAGSGERIEVLRLQAQGPLHDPWWKNLNPTPRQPVIDLPSQPYRPWEQSFNFNTVTDPGVTLVVAYSQETAGTNWTDAATITTDAYGFAESGDLPTPAGECYYRVTAYTNAP